MTTSAISVRSVTDDSFQAEVLESERPVIVDFWAAWCGPCRLVAPEIDKLAEKYAGSVEVVKLDVDANPHTAMHYGIMSIPTVAFFAPGQPPRAAVGFRPAEQYRKKVERQCRQQHRLAKHEPKARAQALADRFVARRRLMRVVVDDPERDDRHGHHDAG